VRHRYINFKCFRAEGALPVYRAQAGSFKAIFGDVEAARLAAHFDAGGGDTTGEIDDRTFDILNDNDEIKRNRNKPTLAAVTESRLRQGELAEQDACVDALFTHYRTSGFPVYDLSPRERAERLAALMAFDHSTILKDGVIRQTMHGMSLCWHYHPHMWDIRCGGKRTPMDVFLSDRLFKLALARRLEMGGYVTDGGIRKALANYSGTQRVSTFRPTAAASIYRELLPVKDGTTWDFSGGFGGRLLGALACRRVKRYIASEPSTMTMEGLKEIVAELVPMTGRRINVELHQVGSENFIPDKNSLDAVFSSGPYFANEQYSDEPSQSFIRFPTRHEWMEGYMGGTLANARRGLKPGGFLAVNIANVPSYPRLESDFLALAKRDGWKLRATLQIEMSQMFGTKGFNTGASKQYKMEPLFVFVKR
jgi:hypothetical protein